MLISRGNVYVTVGYPVTLDMIVLSDIDLGSKSLELNLIWPSNSALNQVVSSLIVVVIQFLLQLRVHMKLIHANLFGRVVLLMKPLLVVVGHSWFRLVTCHFHVFQECP